MLLHASFTRAGSPIQAWVLERSRIAVLVWFQFRRTAEIGQGASCLPAIRIEDL
jgi:hypothetical protein